MGRNLCKECVRLKESLLEKEEAKEELTKGLLKTIETLHNKVNSLLERDNERLSAENKRLTAKIERLKAEIGGFTAKNGRLTAENEALKVEISELRQKTKASPKGQCPFDKATRFQCSEENKNGSKNDWSGDVGPKHAVDNVEAKDTKNIPKATLESEVTVTIDNDLPNVVESLKK